MIQITCEICKDLIPLVQDGVASGDSASAVERHIQSCPQCRVMWEGQIPRPADSSRILEKVRHRARVFMGMVLMFGVFFGLSLTASSGLFLNSLIMPAIGAIGYFLCHWRSLYLTPFLLFAAHLVTNAIGAFRGAEHLDLASLPLWSALYAVFAAIGTVIAGLLHIVFQKED